MQIGNSAFKGENVIDLYENESVLQPMRIAPPILYHYCSVDVFIKIITSKSLWLTNIFYMNDKQEHYWLRNKARNYIATKIQQFPDEFGYQYIDTCLKHESIRDIYCGCFTERPDDLNQWRGYGDDGSGVAIGFSTEHLTRICNAIGGGLCDVIYEDHTQESLFDILFDLPEYNGEEQTIENGAFTILGRISEASSRCKCKSFADESEWRMICSPMSDNETDEFQCGPAIKRGFRERNGMIMPYLEIPLVQGKENSKRGMEPIKEVYFGPKASGKEQEYATTAMLESNDFKRVKLSQSKISLR